jgi:hypothetical protein
MSSENKKYSWECNRDLYPLSFKVTFLQTPFLFIFTPYFFWIGGAACTPSKCNPQLIKWIEERGRNWETKSAVTMEWNHQSWENKISNLFCVLYVENEIASYTALIIKFFNFKYPPECKSYIIVPEPFFSWRALLTQTETSRTPVSSAT